MCFISRWKALILVLTYGLYVVALIFNSTLKNAVSQAMHYFTLGLKQCSCRQCHMASKEDSENCGLMDGQEGKRNMDMDIDPNSNTTDTTKPTVLHQGTDYQRIDSK